MDIAQLPNLPEKTSESSETSDSESESKENSGREESGSNMMEEAELELRRNRFTHTSSGLTSRIGSSETYSVNQRSQRYFISRCQWCHLCQAGW